MTPSKVEVVKAAMPVGVWMTSRQIAVLLGPEWTPKEVGIILSQAGGLDVHRRRIKNGRGQYLWMVPFSVEVVR